MFQECLVRCMLYNMELGMKVRIREKIKEGGERIEKNRKNGQVNTDYRKTRKL